MTAHKIENSQVRWARNMSLQLSPRVRLWFQGTPAAVVPSVAYSAAQLNATLGPSKFENGRLFATFGKLWIAYCMMIFPIKTVHG